MRESAMLNAAAGRRLGAGGSARRDTLEQLAECVRMAARARGIPLPAPTIPVADAPDRASVYGVEVRATDFTGELDCREALVRRLLGLDNTRRLARLAGDEAYGELREIRDVLCRVAVEEKLDATTEYAITGRDPLAGTVCGIRFTGTDFAGDHWVVDVLADRLRGRRHATMREITTHHTIGLNEAVRVYATDGPGPGGANHDYLIRIGTDPDDGLPFEQQIRFQKGAVKDVGAHGTSIEALIAISMDRLEGFQQGPFRCDDNREALLHLARALDCLQRRTRDRVRRGLPSESGAL